MINIRLDIFNRSDKYVYDFFILLLYILFNKINFLEKFNLNSPFRLINYNKNVFHTKINIVKM